MELWKNSAFLSQSVDLCARNGKNELAPVPVVRDLILRTCDSHVFLLPSEAGKLGPRAGRT
ncbi:unnamed protein product [Gulo gulo]|uniref:Uncharacterized protein n=1 Tax=Gulo gulo TaxID=48420 RepID=A0A9X9MDW8_GULGU|nr:unnamed protein product [Gulo gulo]